jgi:hypothetical protein
MKRLKCISGALLKTEYRSRNHISAPLLPSWREYSLIILFFLVYYPVYSANPVVSLKNLIVKQEDFPLFQVHQAITVGFLPPNSTKQAHFNRFKLLRST